MPYIQRYCFVRGASGTAGSSKIVPWVGENAVGTQVGELHSGTVLLDNYRRAAKHSNNRVCQQCFEAKSRTTACRTMMFQC